MTIFLVRHAKTEGNVNRKQHFVKADNNIQLVEEGYEESRISGQFFENYFFEKHAPPAMPLHYRIAQSVDGYFFGRKKKSTVRLWSSHYERAMETARVFQESAPHVPWETSATTGKKIFVDPRLREREFGHFDGLSDDEIAVKYPDAWQHYNKNNRYDRKPLNGESAADVAIRIHSFKESLWRDINNGHETHVIFTHGFAERCFINTFLNRDPKEFLDQWNPQNTSIYMLTRNRNGRYCDGGYIYRDAERPEPNGCPTPSLKLA